MTRKTTDGRRETGDGRRGSNGNRCGGGGGGGGDGRPDQATVQRVVRELPWTQRVLRELLPWPAARLPLPTRAPDRCVAWGLVCLGGLGYVVWPV